MSANRYLPIIENMVWSYSRISCFDQCPYHFFLRYIYGEEEENKFYTSYGSYIHTLIERYYRGELKKEELPEEFLLGFSNHVKGNRPAGTTVTKYIQRGLEYFTNFTEFKYEMVGVEEKIFFHLGGYKFIGFIDYLGKDGDDFVIIDNKSRELKPRSKRAKPTQKDIELDEMLKQLYLYAFGVKEKYGKYPTKLCFNCFKNNVFIEEEFNEDKLNEVIEELLTSIELIKQCDDFTPNNDFFFCRELCGNSGACVYCQELFGAPERR